MMRFAVAGFSILGAVAGLLGCERQPPASTAQTGLVERGAYLVMVGGCNHCHTPKVFSENGPEPDKSRLLSGHRADVPTPPIPPGTIAPDNWGVLTNAQLTVWAGPWGISYASNLTPDSTGIGGWTSDTFIKALRTGKHAGEGRQILPPMPWADFGKMSDDDLRAIFAYLQSLPPVENVVPQPVPPPAMDTGPDQATGGGGE